MKSCFILLPPENIYSHSSIHLICHGIYLLLIQIAEGLRYLHQYMIIYRDMKPDNILVFSLFPTQTVNVKISDYGIAALVTPGGGLQSQEGTPGYRAPEVINREHYNFKVCTVSW